MALPTVDGPSTGLCCECAADGQQYTGQDLLGAQDGVDESFEMQQHDLVEDPEQDLRGAEPEDFNMVHDAAQFHEKDEEQKEDAEDQEHEEEYQVTEVVL